METLKCACAYVLGMSLSHDRVGEQRAFALLLQLYNIRTQQRIENAHAKVVRLVLRCSVLFVTLSLLPLPWLQHLPIPPTSHHMSEENDVKCRTGNVHTS